MCCLKIGIPFSLVLGLSAPAFAQDDDDIRPDTVIDFMDGSDVTAEPLGPEGARIRSYVYPRRVTFVRPRESYVHELLKSIESI